MKMIHKDDSFIWLAKFNFLVKICYMSLWNNEFANFLN